MIGSIRFSHALKYFFRSRRVFLAAFSLFVVAAFAIGAKGAPVGPIFDPFSGENLYLVGSDTASWTSTEADAEALGGNLVTIHSADENQFIASTFFQDFSNTGGPNLSNSTGLWIGLFDPTGAAADDGLGGPNSQHAANFKWVSGDGAGFRNWNTNEPNNSVPGEYWGLMWGPSGRNFGGVTGTWNDEPNQPSGVVSGFFGVAEVVPEPVGLGVILMSVAAMIRRRERR